MRSADPRDDRRAHAGDADAICRLDCVADRNGHAERDPKCDADSHRLTRADADRRPPHCDPHAHGDPAAGRHAVCSTDRDRHTDRHGDAIAQRDGVGHDQADGHPGAQRDGVAYPEPDSHPGAQRDSVAYAQPDSHADAPAGRDDEPHARANPAAMNTLYVVGTPIGNLEDITLRALRILKSVRLIAAEDTRKTRILLERYEIATPLTSYFEHNKLAKLDAVLAALDDGDVALVSEAGMPGLSDPGYELVRAALARDVPVVSVPGASAAVSALVVSGLPTDQFVFLGFLPRKAGERRAALDAVASERRTLVVYEAPHRIVETLADLLAVLGDRPICVARELTKLHEETVRGSVREALAHFSTHEPRGEFTLVIGGAPALDEPLDDETVSARLAALMDGGMPGADAARQVAAESGRRRREVYALMIALQRKA